MKTVPVGLLLCAKGQQNKQISFKYSTKVPFIGFLSLEEGLAFFLCFSPYFWKSICIEMY